MLHPRIFYPETCEYTRLKFLPLLLLHPLRHAHRIALHAGLNLVTVRRNLVFKNKYGRYTKLSNHTTDLQRPATLYNRDTLFLPALGEQFPERCFKTILMDEQNAIIRRIYEGLLTHQCSSCDCSYKKNFLLVITRDGRYFIYFYIHYFCIYLFLYPFTS